MLSPESQEAIIFILNNAGYSPLKRAEKMRGDQFVKIGERDDGGIEVVISGRPTSTQYSLYFRGDSTDRGGLEIMTKCSCGRPPACDHLIAAAIMLLRGAVVYGCPWSAREDPETVLFDAEVHVRLPELSPRFARQLQVCLMGDAVPGGDGKWWDKFLKTTSTDARLDLLVRVSRKRFSNYIPPVLMQRMLSQLSEYQNPFQALRRYEQSLKEIATSYFAKLQGDDGGLQAFLASPEAKESERLHAANFVQGELRNWLQAPPPIHTDQIEIVWMFDDSGAGFPQIKFSVLLTTKNLHRSPRTYTMLGTLFREVASGKRILPPEQKRLLLWMNANRFMFVTSRYEEGTNTTFPMRGIMPWLSQWLPMGLVKWDNGVICSYDPRSANLVVAPDEKGQLAWHVRIQGEEGIELLSRALLFVVDSDYSESEEGVYVLRDDVIYQLVHGQMPRRLLEYFRDNPEVPLQGLAGTPAAQQLIVRYLDREVSLSEYLIEVPVRPILEFMFDEEPRMVNLVAFAEDAGGNRYSFSSPGSWIPQLASAGDTHGVGLWENLCEEEALLPVATAPAASAQVLGKVVRNEDVAGVEAWLERFVPPTARIEQAVDGVLRRKWKVSRNALGALVQLWQARPRDVEYRGNRAFHNLIQTRKAPVFHINVDSTGVDLLKISVSMENEMEALSYDEVERALKESEEQLVMLPRGRLYQRNDLENYRKSLDALLEMGIEPGSGERELHVFQFMHQSVQDALQSADSYKRLEALKERIEEQIRSFKGIPDVPVPANLKDVLRPYQRSGLNFLAWACRTFGGAILADDMGLGKTLQTLAVLNVLRKGKKGPGPSLVACPASVAHNWVREAAHFTPGLKVLLLESGAGRKELLRSIPDYDLVVKNFSLTRRDIETLREHKWFMVCVDEAQNIKNPSAEITRAVKSLDASYRIALTGTPIENRLLDLWSMADFTVPGTLGTMEAFLERVRVRESGLLYRTLRAQLRPILLRRLKKEVAPELPPRIEERIDCTMSAGQRRLYLAELKKAKEMIASVKDKSVSGPQRIQILACLTRLRQICCHPALLRDLKSQSGKLDSLMEVVPRVLDEGHKVLVFSQFVTMIDLIVKAFNAQGIPYHVLTGKSTNRGAIVEAFEKAEEPCVFLISLKAGGTGLNLTSASYVILADPWWNPAVEAQAIDRTHRIGQDKTVIAIRLVTLDTIEERIIELQERKRAIVENVLEEDEFNRTLNRDDFAFILDANVEKI